MTACPLLRLAPGPAPLEARLDGLDWRAARAGLAEDGFARLGGVLDPAECAALRASYHDDGLFRARVIMARHGFGRGEYRYFADPLPALVATLRERLYRQLQPIADEWMETLGRPARFPSTLDQLRAACAAAGQSRPTPLLLRYRAGDHNCLHQDRMGPLVFPLQVVFLLSRPGVDFTGGELVLVEQRPRAQSRAEVVPLGHGEAVVFAVAERPARGVRGVVRRQLRHGVSRVHDGERMTLGIIFHDG